MLRCSMAMSLWETFDLQSYAAQFVPEVNTRDKSVADFFFVAVPVKVKCVSGFKHDSSELSLTYLPLVVCHKNPC